MAEARKGDVKTFKEICKVRRVEPENQPMSPRTGNLQGTGSNRDIDYRDGRFPRTSRTESRAGTRTTRDGSGCPGNASARSVMNVPNNLQVRSCAMMQPEDLCLFTRAIVRIPGDNFAAGLTTVALGVPQIERVLAQHARYCDALAGCGLTLTVLDADLRYPDSTFVEDAAVLTERAAILTRPGAASREGEVDAMRPVVEGSFPTTYSIEMPGTLDGGDICEAENHFFIGLSHRTNQEGARQLSAHLAAFGYTSSTIDIRAMNSILHFKSGVSYIGDNT